MNKKNNSMEEREYSVTISDWLQFLLNTKTTDIHMMISVAAFITAIATISFGIGILLIEEITIFPLVPTSAIFFLILGLSAYYFIEIKSLGYHLPPRKEWKKAQKLIDEIIVGNITDPQEIKKDWLNKERKKNK